MTTTPTQASATAEATPSPDPPSAPDGLPGHPGRLPLAERADVSAWVGAFLRGEAARLVLTFGLFAAALVASLIGPRLLGHLVESVKAGTTASRVDQLALAFVAILVVKALLARAARTQATLLGERVLARTRENFVRRVLGLPLSAVESVGTGDLLSRATTDADRLNESIRQAVPRIALAAVSIPRKRFDGCYDRRNAGSIPCREATAAPTSGPKPRCFGWSSPNRLFAT
ncbi:ABC transporter transmembrane domain-containing protein [Streptomyces asiaticus]|uniref:ABC transporter transmembrane domain-containing protein n=1 Tax=Streptomyces asiaticus TaxID=114695 RepID=UPI003D72E9E7